MNKYYMIYGIITRTNFQIDILTEYNPSSEVDLDICVHSFSEYNESLKNDKIIIDFHFNLVYLIDPLQKNITVFSDDINKVVSSVFNIPFGVFLAISKECVLIHGSAVLINDKICIFSGNKKVGKSTLTYLMSSYYPFVGDDTICVSLACPHLCCSSGSFIRIDKSILDHRELSQTKGYNISGKAYFFPDSAIDLMASNKSSTTLGRIFYLDRHDSEKIETKEIGSKIKKQILLANNIIGNEYLPFECINNAVNALSHIHAFKMTIPNSIPLLKQSLESFSFGY
ncbi:MAG: hypothetical protein MJ137_00105 [Clostridia bacterium]|nr:hypothetical protein [Clostridia bacterium]